MTNILIEGAGRIPSFELTAKDYELYSQVLPINVRSKLTRNIKPDDISWCDVLLTIRGGDPLSCYLVRELVKANRKVVINLDDDLLEYKWKIPYYDRIFRESLCKIIDRATCIQTPSKYLGEKYSNKFNIRYSLFDTVVDSSKFVKKDAGRINKPVKIVYAAGSSHYIFFDAFIKPILDKLYDKYGQGVSLTIVGPNVDVKNIKMEIQKVSSMPMEEYREYMKKSNFDIGLAPLFDEEFCRSKYFNKYIEYTSNGICGIYSNVLPYISVVKNGRNGILSDNNTDDWFNNICRLIDDGELRCNCVIEAQRHLTEDFNLNNIANRVFYDMKDLLTYKAPELKCKVCRFMYLRYLYWRLIRRIVRFYYENIKWKLLR